MTEERKRRGREKEGRTREPSNVLLGADWVARWLTELDPHELRAYILLARESRMRTYHDPAELRAAFGDRPDAEIERRLEALEEKGLIEVVKRRGKLHYHLLCVGADGIHRAGAVRPSIKEALESHKSMMEELLHAASLDETEELRERTFRKYPALRDEFELGRENRDPDMPPWRMWIELSLYLMSRFEERYGSLKAEHGEVFKEVSAQLLRLKLEIVDRLTKDILDRRADLFPARGAGWIAGIPESAFVALPVVRELSRKYRVGAEQIYLNTMEALQAEGLCIVELDSRGRACDLLLPSTTGLAEDDERLVFLHVEEMTRGEIEEFDATLRKIREAKGRYGQHLVRAGVLALIDLARKDRIGDLDAIFQLVADRANEALDLVREDGEDPRVAAPLVTIEDVIGRYDELRKKAAKVKE